MNLRYRKSMQLEVQLGNIYEAYVPTVLRDMLYGTVRRYVTGALISAGFIGTSPEVLLLAVILARAASAPLNEWRGYQLQTKAKRLTLEEFFRLENFLRSLLVGMVQGLALSVGYSYAPAIATQLR
ncbi:unnamed protein product [Effrenium voratum]|nr:unnamed protein product [Effrenium voratum]